MRTAAGVLLLLLVGGVATADPVELPSRADKWFRLQTANFTVFSDTTESRAREIALDLERLRAVLLYIRKTLTANSPVPTYLYVFKRPATMEPYMPPDLRAKNFGGFFQSTDDGNYLALAASWNSDPRALIYNGYLHYFLHANFRPQPLWYEDGVAEFYRSFRATDTEAQTGLPIEEYIALLRTAKMIPLDQLFAVERGSPVYTNDLTRDVFFAESWALVHYLLRGKPERTPQLARFLVALQDGTPRDAAFHEAFQMDYAELFAELFAYVRGSRYNYARIPYKDLAVPTESRVEPLSYAQTLFRLGDLLLHENGRLDEAEQYFQAALQADPAVVDAETGLGVVALRREQYGPAAEHFQKAIASGRADYRAYYYDAQLGMRELFKNWSWPASAEERASLEAVRASLRKSIALNPNYAEARAELGRTYMAEDAAPLDEGIEALTTASKLLPSRQDVAIDLVKLKQRRDEQAGAAAQPPAIGPTPLPGSRVAQVSESAQKDHVLGVDSVNALLKQGKEDEAVAAMEKLVAHSHDEMRAILEDELVKLKAGVARNKAMHAYNAAIALYNRRDYAAALAAFEKVATGSPDADIARAAREKATEVRSLLKRN
ncbi:MAG TPA: tetratricopeptide repeat protein [Thermoanaerobaculia bacterium]|jgi:tetratricopeptide (TPR) repeat protein|nr:tetratricopeptide repeat protein [Thermoanaerobaculia bacterium]